MRRASGLGGWVAAGILGLLALGGPAAAVEYRLQVANLHEHSLVAFLRNGELRDGGAGPGLERLAAALERGDLPKGALLDRHIALARESLARAYGAVPVRAEVRQGGEGSQRWDEVRWEGVPGERTVWVVISGTRRPQRLLRVALKGAGPMRHYQPYTLTGSDRYPVMRMPLSLLWALEERGTVWDRYLARGLDLGQGIAVVTGANENPTFADHAVLVIAQPAAATTFQAVLGWKQDEQDIESPSRRDTFLRWR